MLSKTEIDAHITRNPEILRGKPTIRGTRISVELINDFLFSGETIESILDDYPILTRAEIEAAVTFAKDEASR